MSVDKTQDWAALTSRGFAAMSRSQNEEAARCWIRAANTLKASERGPLLAASLSNAGVAQLILRNECEAARAFSEADHAWQRVVDDVATLDVPITGASSSFHFRLAVKAPNALGEARRRRYRLLAEAALAITRFNHLFVDALNSVSGAIASSTIELKAMLADSLGSNSAEVRLLSPAAEKSGPASVFSIYSDKVADVAARQQTLSTAISEDCAEFETAVALTALLGPQIFAAIKKDQESHRPCVRTRMS